MEYQRRNFYGLRQPILEGVDIRGASWRFLEPAIHEAADLYLGSLHVPNCVSEWAREKMNIHIEPSRLRGKDRDQIHKMLVVDALEEAQHKIELVVAETMPQEIPAEEFDISGLQKWAHDTFATTIETDLIKSGDRLAVRKFLEAASHNHIESIELTPLDSLLVPDFSAKELCLWSERYLSVQIDPGEFVRVEDAQVAAVNLVRRAREAYAERERTYPIDFAIKYTTARLQADAQSAITSFCSWANTRFQMGWNPQELPSSNPAELRELLLAQSRKVDDTWIQARAAQCIQVSGEMDAANMWLGQEYQTQLTRHDRASFALDPHATVAARIRETLRSELSQFERWIILQTIDNAWKDHLRSMDQIRDAIGFRAFSQKDPRIEFKKESSRLYIEMMESVQNRLSEVLLKGELVPQVQQQQAPAAQTPALQEAPAGDQAANQAPVVVTQVASKRAASANQNAAAVVGRNEICPCGSGKKYKHCHGAKGSATPLEQSQP